MGFFQLPWLPEWALRRNGYAALRRALRASSRRGTFSDGDLAAYERAWREPGALTGMLNWYRALPRRPRIADARVAAPTLLIWGERDRVLERGLGEASLALARPAARSGSTPRTGCISRRPRRSTRAITEFMA